MRIVISSFTQRGALLAAKLAAALAAQGHACEAYAMPRHTAAGVAPLAVPLSEWTAQAFQSAGAIVYISACGVAVRAVAPYLKSKAEDPAVVVLDDNVRFCISLLSGHIGGANALAQNIACLTGAQAVISTATDGAGVFSVDAWAAQEGCALWELPEAKAVSAALLDGERVGFCSDFPLASPLPNGLEARESGALGICITLDEQKAPFARTLHIVPRALVLGIGCKRGVGAQAIVEHVHAALAAHRLSPRSVCAVYSITIKRDEPGLLACCEALGVPLRVFSADELSCADGAFSASEFVRGVTGVDNVCERAAVLGAGEYAGTSEPDGLCGNGPPAGSEGLLHVGSGGRLVMKKQAGGGVTVAAAVCGWEVQF